MNAPAPPDRTIPAVAVVILLVAATLTGLGAFSGTWIVQKRRADVRRGWSLKPVVVAASELRAGDTLKPEDLRLRDVPEQFFTTRVFTDPHQLEGKTLSTNVSPGTALHTSMLAGNRECP